MKIKGLTFKEFIHRVDLKIGFSALERLFSTNWFNPFATAYLNLRSFPFAQAISLLPPAPAAAEIRCPARDSRA